MYFSTPVTFSAALSRRVSTNVDVVVRQDEAAGAVCPARRRSRIARMPCGKIAAMKPPPLPATTLESRIGSPASYRRAHDCADEILDRVRPVGLSDEARSGRKRPARSASRHRPRRRPDRYRDRFWRPAHRRSRAAAAVAAPWAPRARGCRSPAWRQRRRRREQHPRR